VEKHNDMPEICSVDSTVVATRYFGWASPQTPLGSLYCSPDHLPGFEGSYF